MRSGPQRKRIDRQIARRFVRRQVTRAKWKSALTALLAVAFLLSLSGIRLSVLVNQRKLSRLAMRTAIASSS